MAHEWDEYQIRTVLQEQGLLNRKFEDKRSYILICCPFHNDKNPSLSISLTKGVCKCFGCDFSGTFTQFIYKLFGGYDQRAVEYVRKFQKGENFKFEVLPLKEFKPKVVIPSYDDLNVPEEELAKYDYTDWVYSKGRGISEDVCRKFRLGIDYKWGAVTFPLMMDGRCIAICRRELQNKKFHIPTELGGRKPLAYLQEAQELAYENKINKVVLVESCYNALTCYTRGIPAVATMGTPTEIQAEILKQSMIGEILIACDGDSAGTVFTLKWRDWLKDKKKVIPIQLPEEKDVNDIHTDDPTGKLFNDIIGKIYWNET
ncbi:MAG: toprim domain-containing protein [Clostridiales bacterium]|jgi:DNA primase|nr:toprim domain-containing protein [Clostridiales bacterium]